MMPRKPIAAIIVIIALAMIVLSAGHFASALHPKKGVYCDLVIHRSSSKELHRENTLFIPEQELADENDMALPGIIEKHLCRLAEGEKMGAMVVFWRDARQQMPIISRLFHRERKIDVIFREDSYFQIEAMNHKFYFSTNGLSCPPGDCAQLARHYRNVLYDELRKILAARATKGRPY